MYSLQFPFIALTDKVDAHRGEKIESQKHRRSIYGPDQSKPFFKTSLIRRTFTHRPSIDLRWEVYSSF
jgi:hypothetical protein